MRFTDPHEAPASDFSLLSRPSVGAKRSLSYFPSISVSLARIAAGDVSDHSFEAARIQSAIGQHWLREE
jgi:hypothetical protein